MGRFNIALIGVEFYVFAPLFSSSLKNILKSIGLTQSEDRKEISTFKNFLEGKRTQMYVRFKKFLNVEISKRDEGLRKS